MESWLPIPDTVGLYECSTEGRIRSSDRTVTRKTRWGGLGSYLKRGRVLRTWPDGNGYPTIYLCVDGKRQARNLHRLVARTFHGEPPFTGAEVNHEDGVKANCRPGNLVWCSRRENVAHAIATGLFNPRGPQKARPRRGFVGTPIEGGPDIHFANEDEAALAVGAASRGNISSAANGKLRQAYGYFWRHA